MDCYEYEVTLKDLENKISNIEKIIKVPLLQKRLEELETISNDANFWQDKDHAGEILKEKNKITNILEKYNNANNNLQDSIILFDIAKSEDDTAMLNMLFEECDLLQSRIKSIEIEFMLNEENDDSNAILTIQPGAGGTESQDWSSMLYRMYLRYAERHGFKSELLDYQDGEEAGIKGAAILIKGENAYGYLKNESGVHRLVRNSPFDSNNKRHTSFASIMVSPELKNDIEINIDTKDLRIDTYRSSGAGGQHVNKTESAIRITHIPTGIVVQCQNDRSQHKNKSIAMKMLASKLYALKMQEQNDSANTGEKTLIGFGHQIRSYVLSPYQQVKDLRSNYATSNTTLVLDGDIDAIIESVLIYHNEKS